MNRQQRDQIRLLRAGTALAPSTPNTAGQNTPVSRNLLGRTEQITPIQQVRRAPCTKMTGAARCSSGSGKRSLWAASQNYRNGVTVDSRWSA